ncbi:helix-turn-helix domain-containing protein [Streptomyces sp. HD]|uniref:helix-turn-helix domain-containing protein n=1 Tax=Streptomyces sp. HD TaxID=3020892 RepID=UPI00232DCC3F|nr:helix-turn-helix transcriptional regulator [Streptomyces sp. HD]MDC0773012.1 helix-turn-helix transcriptional regulator [Streptomyces sp. HD]
MVASTERGSGASRGGDAWDRLGKPLGVAVRTRRVQLGLTQQRLAARAGMSQGALSRLEHGKAVPTLPLLERLARVMAANLLISLSPHGDVRVAFGSEAEPGS